MAVANVVACGEAEFWHQACAWHAPDMCLLLDLFQVYRRPTYDGMTRSDPFSNTFRFLMILLAIRPQSPRSVRGPRRRLPPHGFSSSPLGELLKLRIRSYWTDRSCPGNLYRGARRHFSLQTLFWWPQGDASPPTLGVSSHILECEGSAHFPSQAGRQGTNLQEYVCEVRQHPHYCAIRRSTELEGHGSTGPKTVRGDAVEGVPSEGDHHIWLPIVSQSVPHCKPYRACLSVDQRQC
jgi:hypothetical protein